jgi:ABC-2 type transport system permease protein
MLRAEVVKARTTRTAVALTVGAAVAVGLGTASMVLSQPAEQLGQGIHQQQFYFIASIAVTAFAAVLGVRSFTDEFRYGSIVPTFLLEPRRGKVLAAKWVSAALIAVAMAVVAQAVMIGMAFALGGAKGARPGIAAADLSAMAGLVVAAALWAALGVGIGAAVRHQIASIVGVIVWVSVVENVVAGVAGGVAPFLPARAAYALAGATATGDILAQPAGGVLLVVYAAVAALVGLAFVRQDVQAA